MKPVVNTDENIPEKMFNALCLLETYCVANGKSEITEEEAKNFLKNLYSEKFANKFKKEYLYQ